MFLKFKQLSIAALFGLLVCTGVVSDFIFVTPVSAQIPVTVTSNVPEVAKDLLTTIKDGIKTGVTNAFFRIAAYAMRKVAYDSAVWIASGGQGQRPFAHGKGVVNYLQSVGDEAAGSAIEELGKPFGMNLCQIPDIKVDLNLKIGLRTEFSGLPSGGQEGKPNCSLSEFTKNWGDTAAWNSKYGSADALTKQFNATLSKDDNDLGIQLQAAEKINEKIYSQRTGEAEQRAEGQGVAPKTTKVSKDIQTPAAVILEAQKGTAPAKEIEKTEAQLNAAAATGDVRVLPTVLSIFLNTLGGSMIKNFQEKGMLPFGVGCIGPGFSASDCSSAAGVGVAANNPDAAIQPAGRAAAEAFFDPLQAVKIDQIPDYDILSQLSTCDALGVYNCRADDGLVTAVKQAESGGAPVTIAQAMRNGWLHGSFKLIPESSPLNSEKTCYQNNYCYDNIKVLRQARILPLGFEIATQKSDPDHPWTLGQVVNKFNDCPPAGASTLDPSYPFCHLIDPNWVIKVPLTKCNALGYGPQPLSADAPDRLQDCSDVQSCIEKDPITGKCINYAYCTREQNVWNFGNADKCASSEFATCRTYTNGSGTASYLYRTLDTGVCSFTNDAGVHSNVGCRAYSLTQDKNGKWLAPQAPTTAGNGNTGIFFNKQISTSCSARSAGCTAFVAASSTTNSLPNLRKAPDYLGCYDSIPATSAIVDWPQSVAGLTSIKPNASCNDYAGVCIADEVGCDWYTPVSGAGGRVPGKFTGRKVVLDSAGNSQLVWNDECSAKCVGYAAYREMPTDYSNGQDVSYIIPSSGTTCTAAESGCASFTNLSVTAGDVEKVEYFSYLRSCITPDKDPGKTFITYEGSAETGYQLKTYTLVASGTMPAYFPSTNPDILKGENECSEANYKSTTTTHNPNCRQFNDSEGHVSYRYLPGTTPVDVACKPYRLNSSELASSGTCFQGGEYRDGNCFYNGLPDGAINTAGLSQSCSAAVETCRPYKGNAGNNIEQVVNNTFDDASTTLRLQGWSTSGVTISAESTHVGEHSLEYAGSASVTKSIVIPVNNSFDLTFWAKGNSTAVTVRLVSGSVTADFGSVGIGDTWKLYHLGPAEFTGVFSGPTTTATLTFTNQANGKLFLDNVRLVRINSYKFLVKKTLSVDPLCDSTPDDNLPGEALGCSAYQNPAGETVDLTGFSYLCREGAIGCTALFDTKNTIQNSGPEAHNVRLAGDGGTTPVVTVGNDPYKCSIPVGETGCYVDIKGHTALEISQASPAIAQFVTSTIYIGEDTQPGKPIYLVADKTAYCSQLDIGCTLAGVGKNTPAGLQFETTTIKNDPALYSTMLCQSEGVGCDAFTESTGGSQYFKDPNVVGQKICSFQPDKRAANGTKISGWFWDGVGICKGSTATYCKADADCTGVGAASTCDDIGDKPCYPDYIENDSLGNANFGLWSYGNKDKYQNFVGACTSDQNLCTEFIDRANNKDEAYYLIKNDKIGPGDCGGQVSQKAGCVVLDETDNPNKFYNTNDLYKKSNDKGAQKVPAPQTNERSNDANVIVKVTPDRECGEWLQCQDTIPSFDESTGQKTSICASLGRYQKSGPVKSSYNQPLSESLYRSRDITWGGMDFSGYSLLNALPIEQLEPVNLAPSSSPVTNWSLAKRLPCGDTNCATNNPLSDTCAANGPCGKDGVGTCQFGICVQSYTNSSDIAAFPTTACRSYPEKDSPFPLTSQTNRSAVFSNVNFCSPNSSSKGPSDSSSAYACDCQYTKVNYNDVARKYYPFEVEKTDAVPDSICVGGVNNGEKCNLATPIDPTNLSVGQCPGGTCEAQKDGTKKLIGKQGYCLEYDMSRLLNADETQHPCITWLPVDDNYGGADINNQHLDAGFNPTALGFGKGPFYCVAPTSPHAYYDRSIYNLSGVIDCSDFAYDNITDGVAPYDKSFSTVVNKMSVGTFYADLFDAKKYNCRGRSDVYPGDSGANSICRGPYNPIDSAALDPSQNYIYNIKDLYQTAVDGAAGTGVRPVDGLCPAGTTPGNVTKVDYVDSGFGCGLDYEGHMNISYECVATDPTKGFWADPTTVGATAARNTSVPLQDWCSTAYEVTSGLENKAWTQKLWKNQAPGQPSKATGATYDFGDFCGPFGALTLSETPGGTPIVIRSSQPNDPNPCARALLPVNTDAPYKSSQAAAYGPAYPAAKIPDIQNIFAASYQTWHLGQAYEGQQFCVSNNPLYPWKTVSCAPADVGTRNPDTYCQTVPLSNKCVPVATNTSNIGQCVFDSTGTNRGQPPCTDNTGCQIRGGIGRNAAEDGRCVFPSTTTNRCQSQNKVCASDADCTTPGRDSAATCRRTPTANSYTYNRDNANHWDVSEENGHPPTVLSVGACRWIAGKNECYEGAPGLTITANGRSYAGAGAIVEITKDRPQVGLQFFAYADNNQMPIKSLKINWGDQSSSRGNINNTGFYRNKRGVVKGTCNSSSRTCDGSGKSCTVNGDCGDRQEICSENASTFGTQKNITCDTGAFGVSGHVYECTKDSAKVNAPEKCSPDHPENFPDGCCIFKPRVQVTDSWGWCNGTCSGGVGGNGCYDKSWNFTFTNDRASSPNECTTTYSPPVGPWTYFGGEIHVAPQD